MKSLKEIYFLFFEIFNLIFRILPAFLGGVSFVIGNKQSLETNLALIFSTPR